MLKLKKNEAVDKKGVIWNKEKIQTLLSTNNLAVAKSLIRIYNNQTLEEKSAQDTYYLNNIGFTGSDGKILTSFAESYLKYNRLSDKQMTIARNKMKKYWKQLIQIIRDENPAENVVE